ncbi:YiiX/YebB-like N1pC/P60 family cysteine hydrolase [Roseivivax sp. CAU 1761]
MTETLRSRFDATLSRIGNRLARRLNRQTEPRGVGVPSDPDKLFRTLRTGDVLLVDGHSSVGQAIKYLTQSTWSHSALYVGEALPDPEDGSEKPRLVEVNVGEGCVASPLSKYARYHTRICRPVGLSEADRSKVAQFMIDRIGLEYDLRNIFDLLRYTLPQPPVPARWRRRMLAIGSGDPTRAICSTLMAQAFLSVRYPILPTVREVKVREGSRTVRREIYHIRHHSLYAPRDFDISPYFDIVKPHIARAFDPTDFVWSHHETGAPLLREAGLTVPPASPEPAPAAAPGPEETGEAAPAVAAATPGDGRG